jgi:hypothetical protein
MTKRKTDIEQPKMAVHDTEPTEPAVAQTPADPLEVVVREWINNLVEKTPSVAADRIAAGLHAAGIHTQEHLAKANVNLVRRVLMAALSADAHSLTGLAARFHTED